MKRLGVTILIIYAIIKVTEYAFKEKLKLCLHCVWHLSITKRSEKRRAFTSEWKSKVERKHTRAEWKQRYNVFIQKE